MQNFCFEYSLISSNLRIKRFKGTSGIYRTMLVYLQLKLGKRIRKKEINERNKLNSDRTKQFIVLNNKRIVHLTIKFIFF